MATILDELAMYAKMRVVEAKQREPLSVVQARADARPDPGFAFEKALAGPDLAFICEVKKASPSKGLIAPEFPYVQIAREYEAAGADAISVLTEPKWFLGSKEYLNEISAEVSIPCLRKDFTVDEYMIWSAKARGASAVLLICTILDDARLRAFRELADDLGLSALVEAHDEKEVERALRRRKTWHSSGRWAPTPCSLARRSCGLRTRPRSSRNCGVAYELRRKDLRSVPARRHRGRQ